MSRVLLRMLRLSHRYQVTRLQLWRENKLCKFVDVAEVCRILCQAHLHQGEKLEQFCLSFIKKNMAQVVTLPVYLDLTKRWPEVIFKVNTFLAGISGSAAQEIAEEGFRPKKRPLEGDEKREKEDSGDEKSKRPRSG